MDWLRKVWLRTKALFATLVQRVGWGVFTGIVQAVVRFVADILGWPTAIVFIVVTGGAAVLNYISGIPSEWIWLMAAVALTLGIPPTIRASADLKRASADLIRATSGKQKLDQAQMGLRGPLAEWEVDKKAAVNTSEFEKLEQAYHDGEAFLERDSDLPPAEWRQKIINWFDEAEELVNKTVPNESFMFRTIGRRPKPTEKFDNCPVLLAARLVKLRRIIGRIHADTDVPTDDVMLRKERARRIKGTYAEAVKIRNRARSLQVLDATTESKMDELQEQLTEQISEIAPEKAINLDTLNSYDPRDHPPMKLDDPKRTLEFSELLLRVKKILEKYE